ncbi:Hypothetical protein GSB_153669, partial [Giardia duodenalis]
VFTTDNTKERTEKCIRSTDNSLSRQSWTTSEKSDKKKKRSRRMRRLKGQFTQTADDENASLKRK